MEGPVDADQCFSAPEEMPPAHRAPQRHPAWLIAAGVAAGFLLAAAMLSPTAGAVSPERIVIDCYEPGEEPGTMVEQQARRRT